uniref:Polygalacturonase n=1 Tax=Ananas comosus var. bracteatus TaxID=296719 RepID=A0A6V7PCK2_ANACO|nr:unnamed protein product [Ananas comosus var. bracteatus]
MELARMVMLLVFISSIFFGTCVESRTHHHKKHPKHSNISQPPTGAYPPSEPPEPVEGTILAPDNPDSWPSNSRRNWLVFYRTDGIALQGGGLIDGRGEKWWNLPCKPHKGINGTTLPGPCDSPVALRFFTSSNITVSGVKIQNSPQFHFRFDMCRNVTIDSISISSPALSPNTDGIHVENSQYVTIHNSVISNGDDCISIGAGTVNIDIQNVTCGPSHGIR